MSPVGVRRNNAKNRFRARALQKYKAALEMWLQCGNKKGEAECLYNIGAVHFNNAQVLRRLSAIADAIIIAISAIADAISIARVWARRYSKLTASERAPVLAEAVAFEYRHAHTRATDMPSAMPRCSRYRA